MTARPGSTTLIALALGACLMSAGCAPVRLHQGHMIDETIATAIQPGVDNRDSVARTLGRPSFTGQFDDRDWYYVSRETTQRPFNMPRANEQTVLRVRFDEAGNVERVERSGIELVANIDPSGEETPTLGRDRSFFRDIFGNIGAVGTSNRPAGTADNPQ